MAMLPIRSWLIFAVAVLQIREEGMIHPHPGMNTQMVDSEMLGRRPTVISMDGVYP